jgi:hypothetical protein
MADADEDVNNNNSENVPIIAANEIIPTRSLFGRTPFTPEEKAHIAQKLREKLSHEFVKSRPGPGGIDCDQQFRTLTNH